MLQNKMCIWNCFACAPLLPPHLPQGSLLSQVVEKTIPGRHSFL